MTTGDWLALSSSLTENAASVSLTEGGECFGRDRETGLPVRVVTAPSVNGEAGVRLVLELVFCGRVNHPAVPRVLLALAGERGLAAVFTHRKEQPFEKTPATTPREVSAALVKALRRSLEWAEAVAAAHAARFLFLDFSANALGTDETGGGIFFRRVSYAAPLESQRECGRAVRRAVRLRSGLAPELAQFAQVPEADAWRYASALSPAADVYGFGGGLLRLCAEALGEDLGQSGGAERLRRRIAETHSSVVRILERCLEPEARRRFASMRDVAQALAASLRELGASPPPPQFSPTVEPFGDFPETASFQERLRGHVDRVLEYVRKREGQGGSPAMAGTVVFQRRVNAAAAIRPPAVAPTPSVQLKREDRSEASPFFGSFISGEKNMINSSPVESENGVSKAVETGEATEKTPATNVQAESVGQTAPASPAALLLRRIQTEPRERYRILRELALGGLGRTLAARDLLADRDVLLKTSHAGHPWTAERILKEARFTARFNHPNVLSLLEVGAFDKAQVYFTLPLMQGRDLGAVLAETAAIDVPGLAGDSLAARMELFDKICAGVEHAHARGVLHLDLKPQNVLMDAEGGVAVVDWGVSQEISAPCACPRFASFPPVGDEVPTLATTLLGGVQGEPDVHALGTPAYMAPEQWDGEPEKFTEQTDVYGLGGLLFFLLTGSAPNMVRRYTDLEPYFAHSKTPRPSRHTDNVVPSLLDDLCVRCLRRDPNARPGNVRHVRHVLRGWLSQPEVWARHRPRTAR
jgi:hypothetical protein